MSPTSISPSNTRSRRVPVTSPIAVALTSQRAHTVSTSSSRAGSTTQSIRSWDSETMISNGSRPDWRSGTRRTSRSIPTSPLAAISAEEEVSPAAPRSCSATSSPCSSSFSEHSSSFFSSNGSPICTDGRLSSESSSSAEASTDAPPIPSRPVRAPNSRTPLPTPAAPPRGTASSRATPPPLADQPDAHGVDQAVLLVGVLEVDLAPHRGDADRVAVVADAGHGLLEQVARARGAAHLAEAQGVEDRDRPRADREDVAQDAADAGGGALERLDRAGVVVRLD